MKSEINNTVNRDQRETRQRNRGRGRLDYLGPRKWSFLKYTKDEQGAIRREIKMIFLPMLQLTIT